MDKEQWGKTFFFPDFAVGIWRKDAFIYYYKKYTGL